MFFKIIHTLGSNTFKAFSIINLYIYHYLFEYLPIHPSIHPSICLPLYLSNSFSSVAQSCLTLCDPMNCSTPGLLVHHQLPNFTQTHIHRVGDSIQPSHTLSSASPPAPIPSSIRVFSKESTLHMRLCPTLRNPMDCSMPGLPVHHQLREFTQTHGH